LRSPAKKLAWIVLACACVPHPTWGVVPPDVRVVIDVSAKMALTDPLNLRASAVGMLLQMLPEDAHAGIWTFSDQVDELVKHGITDQLFKQIAEIQLARLPTGGQRSNLLEALDRASWDAVNPSGRSRHIVLLAHGALDISDDNAVNEVAR
jgi:hypothetical protein